MCRVIAVANPNGDSGKTTTAVNMAAVLNKEGRKTLLIDMDGNCDSTDMCRAEVEEKATLYDLLFKRESVKNCIRKTEITDIIASNPRLLYPGYDFHFPEDGRRLFLLKEACTEVLGEYEYIILDTPSTLNGILSNALTFAGEVVIPIPAAYDAYGVLLLSELNRTISAAWSYTNPGLKVAGILLIKYHVNTNLCEKMSKYLSYLTDILDTKVFETRIRESEACRRSQTAKMSVAEDDADSTMAIDYTAFCRELEKQGEQIQAEKGADRWWKRWKKKA